MNRLRHLLLLSLCAALLPATLAFTSAASAGEVSRAQFTSAIENREPIDEITRLDINHGRIYFFSEIRNAQNQTVTHRWLHGDQLMAEVPFNVGGPRWRVYSSKNLVSAWTGIWTVQVVDDNGAVLMEKRFEYVEE